MYNELPISGPLGLGDLLDRAFRLYRERFWTLLLIAALFLVPLAIISGILTGQFTASSLEILRPGSPIRSASDYFAMALATLGLASLLSYLVNGLVTLALTHQTIATLHSQKPTAPESIRAGLGRFLALIGMNLLQGLILVVPLIVLGFLLAIPGCAILLLPIAVVGWIYVYARWLVAVPGLVAERLGPAQALRRSWTLTEGQVWRSVGYSLLLAILGGLVTLLPQLVVQQVMIIVAPVDALALVSGISAVIGSSLQLVWQPLYAAAVVLLYYDLRVRQESYDLSLRVEQLESQMGIEPVINTEDEAEVVEEAGVDDEYEDEYEYDDEYDEEEEEGGEASAGRTPTSTMGAEPQG
jgi:hypothetical protein